MLRLAQGVLGFVGRHATRVLALGIFVGLAFPDLARTLKPYLPLCVALTMVGSLLRLEWRAVRAELARPGPVALALAWLLLGAPFVVAGVALLIDLPPGLVTAMVLSAAGPCIMSTPAICLILGLDGAMALVVMIFAHVIAPLTLPPLALALVGVTLDLGVAQLMLRLALFVIGAMAVAALVRHWLGRDRIRRLATEIDGVNVLTLLVFAIAIMDGIADAAAADPHLVLVYFLAAVAFNAGYQALTYPLFAVLGRRRALTVGFATGNRNMGLLWAALGPGTALEVTLYFAVAQLPMYVLPAVQAWLYRPWLAAAAAPAPRTPR